MADTTYMTAIVEAFADIGDDVNTYLSGQDLPVLKDWFQGEPQPLRMTDTPYAYFDLLEWNDVDSDWQELQRESYGVPMVVGLVVGGSSPAELLETIAATVPHLIAAIESTIGLACCSAGWTPGPRDGKARVRLCLLHFLIIGDRAWGGVS